MVCAITGIQATNCYFLPSSRLLAETDCDFASRHCELPWLDFLPAEASAQAGGGSTSYFDILLAREAGAFAWTKCIASPAQKGGSGNTLIVVSIIAAVLVLGVIWEFFKHRA